MSTFNIGDAVRLKSGGPPMTVVGKAKTDSMKTVLRDLLKERSPDNNAGGTGAVDEEYNLECAWFAGDSLRHAEFHPNTLVEASLEPLPPTTFVGWLKREPDTNKPNDAGSGSSKSRRSRKRPKA